MPKSVQVDGIGVVEFGDDFTEAEIGAQVGKLYEKQSQDRLNVRPVNKPIDPGFRLRDTAFDTYEAQLKASGISPAEAKRAQAAGDLRQEQSFAELPDSGEGGTWAKAGLSVARGAAELSESLNRGLGSLADYVANSTLFYLLRGPATGGALQMVGEVGEYLTDTANEVRKTVKDVGLVEQATPGNKFVSAVAGGVPSLVPSMAAAPLAGLPILMAGFQTYGSVLGDAEEGFRKQGLPPDQVRERGRKVAALGGLTTSVLTFGFNRFGPGLEKWTQGMNSPVGRAGLKELGREFGHEFTEEGLDQFAQGVVARHSYEPDKSWEQIVRESLAAGVAGGTLAAGLKGVTGIDERLRLMRDLAKDDKQFHRMSMRVANDAANLAGLPPTMEDRVGRSGVAPLISDVFPDFAEGGVPAPAAPPAPPPVEVRSPEPLPPGVTLVPPGEVPVVPPGSATFDAGASGTVVFDPAKVTPAAVSVIIDSLPPQAEPTTTSNETSRQPSARPPGVDVREPTATGPAAPQEQQTAPAPGEEGGAGAAPGGPTQGGTGDGRGRSVPGGDGKRARPGGRPGDGGQPTGPAAAPRAGAGVEGAGPKLTATDGPVDAQQYLVDLALRSVENQSIIRRIQDASPADRVGVAKKLLKDAGMSAPGAQLPDGTYERGHGWSGKTAGIEISVRDKKRMVPWSEVVEQALKVQLEPKAPDSAPETVTEPEPLMPEQQAQETKERERIAADTKRVGDTAAEQDHVVPAEGDYFPKGDKAKVRANLEAIALLRRLEAENRNATPEEKSKLAQYVGWGGLKQVFDDGKAAYRQRPPTFQEQKTEFENWEKAWGNHYDEVNSTLTPEERAAAMKSILNAHYTARDVISAVWAGAQRLGFKGGVVLEPAAGVLHFAGLMPEALRGKVKWNAVEQDSVSARIAAKLYPNARVQHAGFEKSRLGPNSQDMVISNVPFAATGPADKRYPSMSLHNYFFARALDVVKPGGIVAMITSDSTMDNGASRAAREYFATKADLVGAVRLPNNAFKANAGTEVTTDILYFRKRDDKPFVGEPFLRTVAFEGSKGEELEINEYFAAHPEMMLGRMSKEGTMYGPEQQALLPTPGADLAKQMAAAMARLPADVMGAVSVQTVEAAPGAEKSAKLGQLRIRDGHAWQVQPDGTLLKTEWSGDKKKVAQAAVYVDLVDHTKATVAQMLSTDATDAELAAGRAVLNKLYDGYHKKYGALNERRSGFLDDDVDFPLALALEDGTTRLVTEGGKARRETTWTKSKIFSERTIFPRVAPSRVDTVADALQVSQNFMGKVDVAYIAQLTGKRMQDVASELEASGMAYENPATGGWENRATYLSGFVKEKLKAARFAAEEDPRFARQVAELEKVQPPDIAIEQIGVKLGSTWVPEDVIAMFLRDQLGVTAQVSYTPLTGDWTVTASAGQYSERNRTLLGIHDWKGHELVERALNLKSPTVTKMVPKDGGGTSEVKDPGKTLQAQQKQQALQKMFKQFVLGNPKVGAHLQNIYNDKYNGVVAPKFEGPTWARYPGAGEDIQLREHQKAVVTRMLQNSTLLAHAVGTGKTYAMVTAAMEMRRLGLAKKPMIVVQNATLEQFARSFKRLYPAARILAPNAGQRDAQNRNRTMARIATGDWDAVIVPQSFVNMLPDDPVREAVYISKRLGELKAAKIQAAAEAGKRSPRAADLQRAIDRLEKRMAGLADRKKDNVLTFEQLGVDALFVDEAHAYKKLEFSTKMENIKGLDTGASLRGWSMSMKTRWVQERNQGRNVIFATGTPVSNTIAEAWNMMRFVRPDVLKAYGMETFDEFASTFGEAFTKTEPTATGDWKPVTRFARFTNGPELIAAWLTTADVVMSDQINLPGMPALKNGKPTPVNVPKTPDIASYIKYLQSELLRFAAMSGAEKRENTHIPLVVQALARKAMADMRMIDPDLPDQPGSKLNEVVRRVLQVHRDGTSVRGTQMVFADLFQDNPKTPRFNLFKEMKRKLIAGGIPESEILIVDETVKEARRDMVFTQLNDGVIRVAMGSTERMGIGVNAQDHMIAVHHVAPPHRPMDIEQRNGRMVRQGNQNPEVEIFNYGVSGSLDSAMYDLLATKQLFTNQLMRGDLQGRNFEDAANEASLSFEDAMAAFSDDPRARLRVGLQSQVRDLEMLRSGHAAQVRKSVETVENLKDKTIPYQEKVAGGAARRAAAFAQSFGGKDFTLEAGGTTVTGRKEVGEALDRAFKAGMDETLKHAKAANLFGEVKVALGRVTLNGMAIDLKGEADAGVKGVIDPTTAKIAWEFVDGNVGGRSTTGQGFYHSLTAALERIAGEPGRSAASLENERRNLRELAGFITQPFGQEQELVSAKEKLAALEAELGAGGKAAPPSGEEGGEKTQPGASSDENSDGEETIHEFSGGTTVIAAAAADLGRLRNLVAPQTAGGPARFAGNLLRELNAKMANELARADIALHLFRKDFDRTPVKLAKFKYDPTLPLPRNLAFIDAYESGNTTALAAGDQLAAAEFHRLNAADLARVQALGTGALTTFYQNYFPHIWQDPKAAAAVMGKLLGKSPLEGSKAFLKQRTHQLFVEGLAAGLKPVHDNPVDLWLLKKREIERYILAHDFTTEMKAAGLMKFKYAFAKAPDGWSTVNDKAFTVYGPPTVTIKEAFDAGMREATLDLLSQLGVPHERLTRIGGRGRWGYEVDMPGSPGTERIVTKFGGPEFVIWHELGHVLHNRYADLQPLLNATPLMQSELAALADARTEATSPASFKRNVRTITEKMAVVLQAYVHAPDEMARLAPTVKAAFESFLVAHPELAKINDIRPGLRLGVGESEITHGGLLKLGDYVMPEAAAKVVNNFLSPGLNTHLWYRTIRETSNLLNSVQLGLSAFHLGFTSLDAATSRLAVGLEDLAAGKPLSSITTIISTIWSPVTNIRTGAKLRAEVLRPGTYPAMAALARALERGGGRVAQDAFWQTEFTRRMKRAWHEGGLQWATLPIRAPLAAWEQTMRPILEYVVPRQKLGVFADMAKRELVRLGPAATGADVRLAMQKAWDSVDNRMGQVVYDNLFYNRAVKDVALISFRAFGWQLGKYREALGAIIDTGAAINSVRKGEKPEFSHRMAYVVALPIMVGTLGALLHYLFTGKPPEEPRDYFQPKTGELDKNGNPVRVNLPSYVKDAMSYAKHPVTSFGHSLNPMIAGVFDLLSNADFYNVEIRHPDDPMWKQGTDVAAFAAKQFIPFSVSGSMKLAEDDAPAWKRIAPFFGVTPVPQRMTMSPSQALASEIMADRMPTGARTKEKFDESKLRAEALDLLKRGQREQAKEKLRDAIDARALTTQNLAVMIQKLAWSPYQFQVHMMASEDAMRVWRIATVPERSSITGIVMSKIANSKTLSPAEKLQYGREVLGSMSQKSHQQ